MVDEALKDFDGGVASHAQGADGFDGAVLMLGGGGGSPANAARAVTMGPCGV